MKKKVKILIIICTVAIVATVGTFLALKAPKPPIQGDIHDTPIPVSIDVSGAKEAPKKLMDAATFKDELEVTTPLSDSTLFGATYSATEYASSEEYTTDTGMKKAERSIVEYFDNSEKALYTAVNDHDIRNIYNAKGNIVYSDGNYKPELQYDVEPIHWFYKDGKLAVCEMFFIDLGSTNIGVAYYDAKGNLLCLTTEIYSRVNNEPVVNNTYYTPDFETIDEATFSALIPEVDAPEFLYSAWS